MLLFQYMWKPGKTGRRIFSQASTSLSFSFVSCRHTTSACSLFTSLLIASLSCKEVKDWVICILSYMQVSLLARAQDLHADSNMFISYRHSRSACSSSPSC